MGNAALGLLVKVFLPLIILVLVIVGAIAFVKICSRRESERGSDDYQDYHLLNLAIESQPDQI